MKKASEILTSHKKFHINLGLERIKKILSLLNNPQDNYKTIHIAGTNGKGSTCKILNELLIENAKDKKTNEKIGLFTSPHLFSYEERIKIDNENISPYIFDRLTNDIDKLALENNIELSEFELICAVAFYYFYIKKADWAIIEVGLGGLFDSTNVINSSAQIITTIDFDHTERLGKTIEEIAAQKAGIIKENSLVFINKDNLGFNKISEVIKEKNAKLIIPKDVSIKFEDKNYAIFDNNKYEFNLSGAHQAKNLALALSCADELFNVSKDTVKKALKNVRWRFRLEYNKEKNLLIDSAHNPSGVNTLKEFLDERFLNTNKTFIFGCLKNKDYKKMLEIILNDKDKFYFFEFDYPNAAKFEELEPSLKEKFIKIENIEEIEKIIKEDKNLKIVFGSIYMSGKIFSKIKI